MNRKMLLSFFVIGGVVGSLMSSGAFASNWRSASPVFDFKFNNHIDSHQKTRLSRHGDLIGFLYITYTGEYNEAGLPIAKHCNKDTVEADCVAGWRIKAKPGMAKMLYHNEDHPVWLVGNRADIPQPGAYSHFHWVSHAMGMSSDSDHNHGGSCNAQSAMDLMPGVMCHGYFMELRAIKSFVFKHHKDEVLVTPGVDISTHVNIVSSAPAMGHDDGGGHGDSGDSSGHGDSGDTGDSGDHGDSGDTGDSGGSGDSGEHTH